MRAFETITTTGHGDWGIPLAITLATVEYYFTSKHSEECATFIRYELRFAAKNGPQDRRVFVTLEEREQFMASSFTNLALSPLENTQLQEQGYGLSSLIGQKLTEITFIHDYIQLHIGARHRFNLYVLPLLEASGVRVTPSDAVYRERISALIGKPITAIDEYLDVGLVLAFEGVTLEIPLDPDIDPNEPEAAEYHGPDGVWKVWRKGELV